MSDDVRKLLKSALSRPERVALVAFRRGLGGQAGEWFTQ